MSTLLLLLPVWASIARAADPVATAARCLDDFDLACAVDATADIRTSREKRILGVRIAFHQGRYADAMTEIASLQAEGYDLASEDPQTPYGKTAE
ncbi:MAG: hypothetical protein VX000_17460, partial [Myxococcota bacterium]|nr:hypothetical protein [Myxococcota bacterium]